MGVRGGTRTGESLTTEYSVQASPHSEVPESVKKAYKEKKINLEALFDGANPFDATEHSEAADIKDLRPPIARKAPEEEANADDLPF